MMLRVVEKWPNLMYKLGYFGWSANQKKNGKVAFFIKL